jgi:DNA polymerase-3 subunit delta'
MLGHDWAVNMLVRHIADHNIQHAYLLTGPAGVGRQTLALRFAQALNCSQPPEPGKPCLECRNCIQIARKQHPDLSIIQSERRGETLRVEQIRELQQGLSLAPYQARYRMAILLRFEEANDSASNALLKTLEEPPDHVILILTANCVDSLLPTIVSRCEVLNLRPLPIAELAPGLQAKWNISPEKANLLAHLSNGCPGIVIQSIQQPNFLERRHQILEEHLQLLKASLVERFAYADSIHKANDKDLLPGLLEVWLSFWRDVMLCAAGSSAEISNLDWVDDIQQLAALLDLNSLERIIASILRTYDLLTFNINPRLAIEVLLLDLPHI